MYCYQLDKNKREITSVCVCARMHKASLGCKKRKIYNPEVSI